MREQRSENKGLTLAISNYGPSQGVPGLINMQINTHTQDAVINTHTVLGYIVILKEYKVFTGMLTEFYQTDQQKTKAEM